MHLHNHWWEHNCQSHSEENVNSGKKKPKKKTVSGMYIITYHQWEHNVQSECMYHQWDHADQTKNYLAAKTCKCKFIQQ